MGDIMKLYSTVLMGFVAIVTSILAYVERKEGFDIEYPSLFWGGQLLLFLIFMTTLLYSFFHWDRSTHVKKYRLVLSVITCICMYAIAYTGSKYSNIEKYAFIFTYNFALLLLHIYSLYSDKAF